MGVSELGKRLRTLRQGWKLTQGQVAQRLGVDRSTVIRWERGQSTPTAPALVALASLYQVTVNQLTDGLNDRLTERLSQQLPHVETVTEEGMVALPVYGPVQCGRPTFITEEPEGFRLVDAREVQGGKHIWFRVEGDSMPPFRDGWYALCRLQPIVEKGETAVVRINGQGEATMRKFYPRGKQVVLQATNTEYDPLILDATEVEIVGKVVLGQFRL